MGRPADNGAVDLALEPDFALGSLTVRPSRREVAAGETRTVLEPRVMQVLVALATQAGEVVSRDELTARCWDGRIVGEDSINSCMLKVRRLAEATGAFAVETIPRVGYRLTTAGPPPDLAAATEVVLAVLPFENASGDPGLTYFSDGVSEEILHTLTQRAGVKVIGRASSFMFRGADKAVGNVARRLGATHILDGSVRRSGQRTRISAELIECASQNVAWSGRFERELSDIFALQDEIAVAVAQAMSCALAPAVRSGAVDPAAYDLYLRGTSPPEKLRDAYVEQLAQLREAVRLAPDFADAWASLGYLLASRAYFHSQPEAGALREQARFAANRALELDPQCGRAAAAMCRAIPPVEDAMEHAAWLEKAIRWAGADPMTIRLQRAQLCSVGRIAEALTLMQRALRLHPFDNHILAMVAQTLISHGDLEQAVAVMEGARPRWNEYQLLPVQAIWALALLGRGDEARAILTDYNPGYSRQLTVLIETFGTPGPAGSARALEILRRQAHAGRVMVESVAGAAQLGDPDEALDLAAHADLDPAIDRWRVSGSSAPATADFRMPPDPHALRAVLFYKSMPRIRSRPAFVGLCARLGLVDYWLQTDLWPDCVDEVAPFYDFKAECRRVAG